MAKNVYLDINGDIIDEIFNLEPKNNIDKLLQNLAATGELNIDVAEPKKKSKKKDTKKKTKSKDEVRVIKICRVK